MANIQNTSVFSPSNYTAFEEGAVTWQAYNGGNLLRQQAAMYVKWNNADASTGYAKWAVHVNDNGGNNSSLSEFAVYGVTHGATFFQRSDTTAPGNRILKIYGTTVSDNFVGDSARFSLAKLTRLGGAPSLVGATDLIMEGSATGGDIYMNGFNAGNIYMNTAGGNVGVNTLSPASTFQVNGSIGGNIRSTSTNTTLDASDYTVIITSSVTVTLPAAGTATRRIYRLVNVAAGSVTISAILRDGASTTTLPNNAKYTIQSDGVSWYVIAD
jgi:hypothetical protein